MGDPGVVSEESRAFSENGGQVRQRQMIEDKRPGFPDGPQNIVFAIAGTGVLFARGLAHWLEWMPWSVRGVGLAAAVVAAAADGKPATSRPQSTNTAQPLIPVPKAVEAHGEGHGIAQFPLWVILIFSLLCILFGTEALLDPRPEALRSLARTINQFVKE